MNDDAKYLPSHACHVLGHFDAFAVCLKDMFTMFTSCVIYQAMIRFNFIDWVEQKATCY